MTKKLEEPQKQSFVKRLWEGVQSHPGMIGTATVAFGGLGMVIPPFVRGEIAVHRYEREHPHPALSVEFQRRFNDMKATARQKLLVLPLLQESNMDDAALAKLIESFW